jgi:hypothetical protein
MIRNIVTQEQFDEEQNRLKYGAIHHDLIAQMFAYSYARGMIFCTDNIQRYARRFIGKSNKAANDADIFKMLDYCERAKQQKENTLINQIIVHINEKEFSQVCEKSKILGDICFNR